MKDRRLKLALWVAANLAVWVLVAASIVWRDLMSSWAWFALIVTVGLLGYFLAPYPPRVTAVSAESEDAPDRESREPNVSGF